MSYTHLNAKERDLLAVLRGKGASIRRIAQALDRDPGTISRELKRNVSPWRKGFYLSHRAHERAVYRWKKRHQRVGLKNPVIRRYVLQRLRWGWSPELIAGRLKRLDPQRQLSYEAIYQYIYAKAPWLIRYLHRAHRKRRRYIRKPRSNFGIPRRISIQERPAWIEARLEAGHWEADTARSNTSNTLLQIVVERKLRYAKLNLLTGKTASGMRLGLTRILGEFPAPLRRTITYDNGSENAEHEALNRTLGTRSYFCDPYHSWQKGTVENTIGLVRRFLPKGTNLSQISNQQIQAIEQWLNTRPRKCLNYQTPAEALKTECVALAS